MRYCGRDFTQSEIESIRRLIADERHFNRLKLSRLVCDLLGWRRFDGKLKDMSCRVAMLRMQADGLIQLPPPKTRNANGKPYLRRTVHALPPLSPIIVPANHLTNLRLELVADRNQSYLWNELIDRYHYLGFKPLPGAQLRYFAYAGEQILALFGFGAAAWKTLPRDQFIGWTAQQRQQRLHLVINNARFLILPWIRSHNLASLLLSAIARRIASDWQLRYRYRPVLLETFVELPRPGTCYKAANWIYVGQTTGLGKLSTSNKPLLPKKAVWLYPLVKNFRQLLLPDCISA